MDKNPKINFCTIYIVDISGSMKGWSYNTVKEQIYTNENNTLTSNLDTDTYIITFNNELSEKTYSFENNEYKLINIKKILNEINPNGCTYAKYIIINLFDIISKYENNNIVFIIYFISDGHLNDREEFKKNIINTKTKFDKYSIIMNAIFLGNRGDVESFGYLQLFNNINISSIYKLTFDNHTSMSSIIYNNHLNLLNISNYKIIQGKKFPWDSACSTSVVHNDFINLEYLYNAKGDDLYINIFTINLLKSYMIANKKLNCSIYPEFMYNMFKYLLKYKPWKFINDLLNIFEIESISSSNIINPLDINETSRINIDNDNSFSDKIFLNEIIDDFKTSEVCLDNVNYFMIFANTNDFKNPLKVLNFVEQNNNVKNNKVCILNPTNDVIYTRIILIPNVFKPIYTQLKLNNEQLTLYSKLGVTYIERMNSGNITILNNTSEEICLIESFGNIKISTELIINSRLVNDSNINIITDIDYIQYIRNKRNKKISNNARDEIDSANISIELSRSTICHKPPIHDTNVVRYNNNNKIDVKKLKTENARTSGIYQGAILTEKKVNQTLILSKKEENVSFKANTEVITKIIIINDEYKFMKYYDIYKNQLNKFNILKNIYNIPVSNIKYDNNIDKFIVSDNNISTNTLEKSSIKNLNNLLECKVCFTSSDNTLYYINIDRSSNLHLHSCCGNLVCKICGDNINSSTDYVTKKCPFCRSPLYNNEYSVTVRISSIEI